MSDVVTSLRVVMDLLLTEREIMIGALEKYASEDRWEASVEYMPDDKDLWNGTGDNASGYLLARATLARVRELEAEWRAGGRP